LTGLLSFFEMASSRICLRSLISASIDILPHSSAIIREVAEGGNLQKKFKIADDPVTIADVQAQALIVSSLRQSFPSLTIIGEETTDPVTPRELNLNLISADMPPHLQNLRSEDIVVWVDPLDGTRSFVAGQYEHVTTLIGVAHRGLPIAGIVHYPFGNETIWGCPGLGVFGCEVGLSQEPQRSICFGFWHSAKHKKEYSQLFPGYELVESGGTGHCCIEVLKGNCGAFVGNSGSKWDTCAVEALLNTAGGRILSRQGKQIFYHKDVEHSNYGCVASLQNIHELIPLSSAKL